jgi:hypothetical protein
VGGRNIPDATTVVHHFESRIEFAEVFAVGDDCKSSIQRSFSRNWGGGGGGNIITLIHFELPGEIIVHKIG